MRTIALMTLLSFLAACGGEEAHDHDHDKTDKSDMEKKAGETMKKAPSGGGAAEMKSVTLAVEGMT